MKIFLKSRPVSFKYPARFGRRLFFIMVNNTKIAKGEVVMVGERFGVRFTEIVDPAARMESI